MRQGGRKGPSRRPGEASPGHCDQGKRVLFAGGPRRRLLDNLRSTPLLPGMLSAASPCGDQMTNEADFALRGILYLAAIWVTCAKWRQSFSRDLLKCRYENVTNVCQCESC